MELPPGSRHPGQNNPNRYTRGGDVSGSSSQYGRTDGNDDDVVASLSQSLESLVRAVGS